MPKVGLELTDAAVRRLQWGVVGRGPNKGKPCTKLHAVGGVSGLYLQCSPPASEGAKTFARSWILKVRVGDDRPEMGLGPYPEVTLKMARDKAREIKEQIRQGIDPRAERRAARSRLLTEQAKMVTFRELGKQFQAKKAEEYRTQKQSKKLASILDKYVYPAIGDMVVADIGRQDIINLLSPHWTEKTETMRKARAYTESILDMAIVRDLRDSRNPATWKGNLDQDLAKPSKVMKVAHYASMPLSDLPDFYKALSDKQSMGALMLRFAVLTASRSGEVRGATWDEIDLDAAVWTIPADRMKGGRMHKVPLTADAIDILRRVQKYSDTLVFPAPRGGMLSDMTMTKVLKDMGHKVTQHGFRATFRTWAQEYTNYQEEVPELALAHVNSDRTRAAYARSELLEKRSKLMGEWQRFCRQGAPKAATVRRIRA